MNHNYIARQMCRLTEKMLWEPRRDWALKRNPAVTFKTRVGSGNRTCLTHKADMSRDAEMTITYGVKMVASKSNPETMCAWLSARELRARGYFGGEINLLNLLAHTMAHEFAHLVQVLLDWRRDNSVHNEEFYRVLDRIHSSGEADKLRDALHEACLELGMDLRKIIPSERVAAALSGEKLNGEKVLTVKDIRVGETLWLIDQAGKQYNPVKVIETMRKRVRVVSLAPGKSGVCLTAPAALLSKTAS